jgi:hypothetical protein
MKIIAIIAVSLFLVGSAHAQGITTNRAYQLCQIEDPSCLPNLRSIYRAAVARNATMAEPYFCKTFRPLTDREIYGSFMQMLDQRPGLVTISALDAELSILNIFIGRCQ